MKISRGLQGVYEDAQLIAQRYSSDYLETWHLLLAFVINPDTVAGAILAEYPADVLDYERAVYMVMGRRYHEELESFFLSSIVQAGEGIAGLCREDCGDCQE